MITKTQRRRTARTARLQAAHVSSIAVKNNVLDYAAAKSLVNNATRWKRVDQALVGLLEIEFTSPFTDTGLLCAEQAHLVVHLDLLRGSMSHATSTRRQNQPAQTPNLQESAARALDAIAMLCSTSKALSWWSDLYHRFWTRVNESDAMMAPLQSSTVDKWIRYTKARGVQLLLSWRNTPFDPSQLIEPLRAFLETPQPVGCHSAQPPVTIGLRVVQASITQSVLERIHELLLRPPETTDKLLIDPTSLRTLGLSSNSLYAPELNGLASILADPKARRVDELKLENFMGSDYLAISQPGFNEALSRVITTAVSIKGTEQAPAFSLSLAQNDLFADQVEVIREAMSHATRPLRALSLANVGFHTWTSLIDLVFLPVAAATPRATLDLSGVYSDDDMKSAVNAHVRRFLDAFSAEGAIGDQSVECCVRCAKLTQRPNERTAHDTVLSPGTFYRIQDFYPASNSLQIMVPKSSANAGVGSEYVTGWIDFTCVTGLRRGGVAVVGTSFSRLIYDAPDEYDSEIVPTLLELTSLMGSHLTGLSLRQYGARWGRLSVMGMMMAEFLSLCPLLEELSLEGTPVADPDTDPFWIDPEFPLPSTLQVLDLTQCGMRDISLKGLDDAFSLRYLSLVGNPIGAVGVQSLLGLLRDGSLTKYVELNPQFAESLSLMDGYRQQIDDLLGCEYLHSRDKAAVLSVLLQLQQQHPQLTYPGNEVAAMVLEYAGTRPNRVVNWS